MARRHKAMRYLSHCAICGRRINRMNGIGFTQENPVSASPRILRTCAKHHNAEFPKEIHIPR